MSQGRFEKKRTPAQSQAKKKASRKGSLWLKILIAVLAVLLVILIGIAVAINFVLGNLGRFDDPSRIPEDTTPITDEFDTDSTIDGQETIQTVDPTDISFDAVDVLKGEDIVNIMLIGDDSRPGEGRSRSDSMILVTLNPKKNAIQMTSFMRDTYVQIPGYVNNRLNVAYRYGGNELMNETFKLNFGIEIDGNVMVNFAEFTAIIDMLGGVDMELNQEEVNYMHGKGCTDTVVGMNHLDGEETLVFVRMRKVSGGDYGRTERQRRVLGAVVESVQDASIGTITSLIKELLPHVVTNLTDAQILNYATTGVALLANGAEIENHRIPEDDAHYGAMIDGMSVLVPDLEECRRDLEQYIYATEPNA